VQHGSVDFSDLYQLADATQRLYLNLPSLYDYRAELKAQRQRLLHLIKRRPAP
jgi:hypothetical protein